MGRAEITAGEWMFRRIDPRNWQVFEHREVKANTNTKRGGEVDWMPMPNYFGSLLDALRFAKERNRERGLGRCGLEDACRAIAELDADFERAVAKAVRS